MIIEDDFHSGHVVGFIHDDDTATFIGTSDDNQLVFPQFFRSIVIMRLFDTHATLILALSGASFSSSL